MSTIAGWMVMIAVIGVAIALFREIPAAAFLLMFTVVPALVVTELVDSRRRRRGRPMSREQKMTWILALTIQIPALLALVLGLAFCLYVMIR
jgi:hypothetical protein